jgi:hypothetical protein
LEIRFVGKRHFNGFCALHWKIIKNRVKAMAQRVMLLAEKWAG